MAAARKAIELGYGIVSDDGPSGRLRHWAIAGVPQQAMDLHSKRSDEIDDALDEARFDSYRARGIAARTSRSAKRFEAVDDLVPRWRQDLTDIGRRPDRIIESVRNADSRRISPEVLHPTDVRAIVEHLLGPDGPLAAQKVFSRRDVMVEAAPFLYGLDPGELDRVVDAVLDHGAAIPLVARPGADEQPFAPACVLAIETAIARSIERAAIRRGAPSATAEHVVAALDRKESELGRAMTVGQRAAIEAICTSGRGIDVIVGVAGSGKTTALDAARTAFQSAGYRVVGTATSGQAAQTLGAEAQVASSTVASLLWRLDRGSAQLDELTVVILDEAGMTDDHDLLRLVTAADMARAKIVLVGDHRQLGAVGPGGGLEGVADRHVVHVLDENVRQRNQSEIGALAQLRDGDVSEAVGWYLREGAVEIAPRRSATLATCAHAWADDVQAGYDTTMLAWRRTSVDALNALGRAHWERAGRLTGPEVHASGGRSYRAGDRVVTLSPSDDRSVVTSTRATVVAVDLDRHALTIELTDGSRHELAGDELSHDRLAHGYAVTVHRSQGATHGTAHVLEDGGGRELAYVKMSRARDRTTVYAVADDLDQVETDLRREWGTERRQRWAIDTGTPITDLLEVEDSYTLAPSESMALRLARVGPRARRALVLDPDRRVGRHCPGDPAHQVARPQPGIQGAPRHAGVRAHRAGARARSTTGRPRTVAMTSFGDTSTRPSGMRSPGRVSPRTGVWGRRGSDWRLAFCDTSQRGSPGHVPNLGCSRPVRRRRHAPEPRDPSACRLSNIGGRSRSRAPAGISSCSETCADRGLRGSAAAPCRSRAPGTSCAARRCRYRSTRYC